jgi:lysophospholipase L1-like esterase
MPFYAATRKKYLLNDGHPNALGHRLVAEAMAEYLLKHQYAAGEQQ